MDMTQENEIAPGHAWFLCVVEKKTVTESPPFFPCWTRQTLPYQSRLWLAIGA